MLEEAAMSVGLLAVRATIHVQLQDAQLHSELEAGFAIEAINDPDAGLVGTEGPLCEKGGQVAGHWSEHTEGAAFGRGGYRARWKLVWQGPELRGWDEKEEED
jgi:hypothetical protein